MGRAFFCCSLRDDISVMGLFRPWLLGKTFSSFLYPWGDVFLMLQTKATPSKEGCYAVIREFPGDNWEALRPVNTILVD